MENLSYRRKTPLVVTEQMRREIAGAVAEIDLAQMEILRRMTPAERVHMAASMIADVERVAVFRLRQRESELSEAEAYRIVRTGLLEYERQKRRLDLLIQPEGDLPSQTRSRQTLESIGKVVGGVIFHDRHQSGRRQGPEHRCNCRRHR
jgi:hypothetical protein